MYQSLFHIYGYILIINSLDCQEGKGVEKYWPDIMVTVIGYEVNWEEAVKHKLFEVAI